MITFKGPQPPPENKKSGTIKYLVTWVDQFWEEKEDGVLEFLKEKRRTQVVDDFEPTQNGIRKFEQSQKIEDKEHGLYWTALVLSFSKLEE